MLLGCASLWGKPNAPVPITAFDGGVISAESLGRGASIASNRSTPGSGSENPASLVVHRESSFYTTLQVGLTSDLPSSFIHNQNPLSDRIYQYGAMASEKGVFFFEPLSRMNIQQTNTTLGVPQNMELATDAIGFAGAQNMKRGGSYGLSLAYLRSQLHVVDLLTGGNQVSNSDAADGLRMNLGVRYPTGPAMWGIVLQNAPGFLFWKDYRTERLPLKIRIGNTVRLKSGILFSIENETRYYDEGSDKVDFVHLGAEMQLSSLIFLRSGVFADHLDRKEERHWTGGLTIQLESGPEISYAIERYEELNQKISKSYISLNLPFMASGVDGDE